MSTGINRDPPSFWHRPPGADYLRQRPFGWSKRICRARASG